MQQAMIACKYCGGPLDTAAAVGSVIECKYCHRKHIVAKSENKNAVHYLEMGEHDLDSCNFDAAFVAYQKAAEYDDKEPEAYFGMALAEFRVQYIKDTVNGRLQAICHDISAKAFSDNKNYKQALKCATTEQQQEYQKRAEEIDYIRGEFYKLQNSGLDYDCFICVKVTGENGKTKDYKTADDLYFHLRGKGYSPFFSEREISNRTGVDYEAFILYALHSSECMIVVCSDESYLNTPWVKNEYTRFCELVADKQKESDSITIVFDGNPIERLPGKTGRIQGVDIRKADAYGKIVEYVDGHTPEAKARRQKAVADKKAEEEKLKQQLVEQAELQAKQLEEFKAQQERARLELESKLAAMQAAPTMPQAQTIVQSSGASAGSLLVRAKQFLSAGDFDNAESYCNRVLDMEPENADAWFLLLLVNLKITDYANSTSRITNSIKKSDEVTEFKKHLAYVNASKYARASAEFVALDNALNELYKKFKNAEELSLIFDIEGEILVKCKKDEANVVIPDCVTCIGKEAFKNCNNLTSVKIPKSVTCIESYAFYNCKNLSNIEIPNSVTSIGERAFQYCSSLTSIEIPNSVTSIGEFAFYYSGLKYIEMPDSITKIDNSVFDFCSSLTSIKIPNSVTSIGINAFNNCSSLTSINIPNSVTSIGIGAFWGCSNLTSIDIPNSVTSIVDSAFYGCSSLTCINIPNSVTSIGNRAFCGCSGLTNIEIPNTVTSIGDSAFSGCSSLTSIEIPNSITSIGEYAFSGCSSLTSIEIPNSITSIGGYAFCYCSSLLSVNIPNSVTTIGSNAFLECGSLKSVELSSGITEIGYRTFEKCSKLTNIELHDNIGKIYDRAFYDCKSLTNICIPNSVKSIGKHAFFNCIGLTSIEIQSSAVSIENGAFSGCSNVTNIKFLNGVVSIDEYAFSGCIGLMNVEISDSVTQIERYAFYGCVNIKEITIPKRFKSRIEEIFDGVDAVRGLFKKAKIHYT